MIDGVLLLALALFAGAPLALAPVPTLVALVGVAVALRRSARAGTIALAALAVVVSGIRAHFSLRDAEALHARAVALLDPPARCEGEGMIVESPVVVHGVGQEAAGRVVVAFDAGRCGDRLIYAGFRARLYGAPIDLARGDRVSVVADLAPAHLFLNDGLADPRPNLAHTGVASSGGVVDLQVLGHTLSVGSLIDRARASVRRRIEATFHPDAEALARALVLGEADLDPVDDEAFRESGLSHLLAVSGTHLVLAVLSLTAALRALLARVYPLAARFETGRVAAAIAIPATWLYTDFAGGSGSAIRAAAMLTAAMLTVALGQRPDPLRAFAWSLLVPAALDPLLACDISFALSGTATAGLIVLKYPIASVLVRGPGWAKKPLEAVSTTLAATLGCAPLIAILSPTLPMLGVVSNLLAAPLGELAALPICLAHALLAWAPPVERGAALLGSGALLGVRAIARWSVSFGAALPIPPPTPSEFAVLAILFAATWAASTKARRAAVLVLGGVALFACELVADRAGAPRGRLRVSVLDVGQGDSLLVDLPDGSAMLIDGGGFVGSPVDPGTRVVLPVLRARRRSRVDVVVLTHPHPDHFTGLASAVPALHVGELWDTGQGEAQGAGATYASLLASVRAQGAPVLRPSELCGRPRSFGGATVEVLAPCPGYSPDASANDNSFVLRLRYGESTALLMGDAERAAEAGLLEREGARLHADFLKVGHHGSRTSSTPSFLAAVGPEVAAISSGVRNRFGHPHPTTLAALAGRHIDIARTDRGGEVRWETDGHTTWVTRPWP